MSARTEEGLVDPGRALANQRLFAELLGQVAREQTVRRSGSTPREIPEGGRHGEGRPLVTDFSWHLPPSHPQEPAPRPPEKGLSLDAHMPLIAQTRNEERLEGVSRSRIFEKEDALAWLRRHFFVDAEWRRIPGTALEQITLRDRRTGRILLQMPLDELIPKILEGERLRGILFSRMT